MGYGEQCLHPYIFLLTLFVKECTATDRNAMKAAQTRNFCTPESLNSFQADMKDAFLWFHHWPMSLFIVPQNRPLTGKDPAVR